MEQDKVSIRTRAAVSHWFIWVKLQTRPIKMRCTCASECADHSLSETWLSCARCRQCKWQGNLPSHAMPGCIPGTSSTPRSQSCHHSPQVSSGMEEMGERKLWNYLLCVCQQGKIRELLKNMTFTHIHSFRKLKMFQQLEFFSFTILSVRKRF